ncbi:MAG: PQQ-binding-like beta-propeller repeat protein [Gemmatimonadota bacterium]|nr:PQQ-binding-like beta-propeller repeat protein [Gemmatimonadota bacterium]
MKSRLKAHLRTACLTGLLPFAWSTSGAASDWTHWRGPLQTGASTETGLISSWSPDGENLIWRSEFIGRSTPVILNGRVYVIGRTGEGVTRQEHVACFDAENGRLVWERKFNVWHSTITFNRLGWANLGADGETGNVYAHLVNGLLLCFDGDGRILWTRSLTEEFNRFSGYGGRLHTPVVDGDLVVISMGNRGWADRPPSHRYMAFDKRTGETVWMARPGGGGQADLTVYSTPVAATVDGQRVLIAGNGNGGIFAFKAATGDVVWGFPLSRRGINTSPVAADNRVYATHSEENVDNTTMGRVVCLDAGTGREIWRQDGIAAGYASPALHAGRLYVVDNSANLHCLDAESGRKYWEQNIGTVGKGSPTWADGKLYVTEVNGGFRILRVEDKGARVLDDRKITMPAGRPAEIYGSVAVAYGRVYFATEAGLFCLGDGDASFTTGSTPSARRPRAPSGGKTASILVVPAENTMTPDEVLPLSARAYDELGRLIGEADVTWSLESLDGRIENGRFSPAKRGQAGWVVAATGGLTARAWVRVAPEPPWTEDFEGVPAGKNPRQWVWGGRGFKVEEQDGNKVLVKPPAARGLDRSNLYIGPPEMSGYTVQADLMGGRRRRWLPDMGLIAHRYILDLQGAYQRLEVRSWSSDLRMVHRVAFEWEPDVWYTMKMRVDIDGGRAIVRGKVWKRSDLEPEAWTIEAEDPLPIREGSPGLYGYSPANIYYDNVSVY